MAFHRRDIDVLVTTTIIESGLDIPSANTIMVNRADRFGLAQMYQLRGRVGRAEEQAYAFLFIPKESRLTASARKRLKVLMEHSDLGSGFQIAMNDLKIRGGGTILGASQSGHIAAVGYDMFLKLMEEAVAEMKGEPRVEGLEPEVNLPMSAYVAEDYVADYMCGQLSSEAKRIMDALLERSPLVTADIKIAAGMAHPNKRAAFDKAMAELQSKMYLVKIGEFYDPFTFLWDLVERRFEDEIQTADCAIFSAQELGARAVAAFNKLGQSENSADTPAVLMVDKRQKSLIEAAETSEKRVLLPMPLRVTQLRRTLIKLLADVGK